MVNRRPNSERVQPHSHMPCLKRFGRHRLELEKSKWIPDYGPRMSLRNLAGDNVPAARSFSRQLLVRLNQFQYSNRLMVAASLNF